MSKISLITFFAIYFPLYLTAQNGYSINIRSGWMYFALNQSAREKLGGYPKFTGPSWVNEISASVNILNKKKFDVNVTSGYMLFWNLEASTWSRSTSVETYVPLRLGAQCKLLDWFKPSIELSNYILTSRKRGERIYDHPDFGKIVDPSGVRTWYTNIDLGLQFALSKKSSVTVSTPFTLLPMFYVKDVGILDPISTGLFSMKVGNKGFNIQYSYHF
jgi:hypothetical protein